ncbi:MurR/RpiR family transcriptional regulator [Bhargavaea beijingensis]|uniref:MurR/RpiR family transcriptional regulator n=1 Tax=Bhargavaea beijingensis TaxID=426756 RepID=UPI002224040D|nr:MurR/RpiR family transcriptional regulator [Bhargavaea beijingensis]MCW1929273.1 MurR/RpiR family transcriptional regulator [Bhargavaea beijingensis]
MTPKYVTETELVFSDLSKGLKKVAECLLHDPITFAIHPAKKIGKIIGVSETMIIRFCRSIGYEGFSQLQEEVRKEMMHFHQGAPLPETEPYEMNPFAQNVKDDIHILQSNLENMDPDSLSSIAAMMSQSERVIVVGYYQSQAFAYWLFFNLNYITGNAYLYRPDIDARLLDITPKNSCVVVFSFYRYAMDTIRFAEEAKKKGLSVILITDSRVSPAIEFADHVISINLSDASLLRKGPVILSIVNSVLTEIVKQVDQSDIPASMFKYFIKDGERKNDDYDFD